MVPALPLPLAGKTVVLDEQGLDVLRQQLIVPHAPVPQDAGGELVVGMAGPAQHHLYHLLTGPVQESKLVSCIWSCLTLRTATPLSKPRPLTRGSYSHIPLPFSLGQGIPGTILCRSYMRSETRGMLRMRPDSPQSRWEKSQEAKGHSMLNMPFSPVLL